MFLKSTRINYKYSFLILLFSSLNITAQVFTVSPKQEELGIEYYKAGTLELRKNNFKKADSLLTLSINIRPYKDNLFNRSIARLSLNDTCGFCNDVLFASKFADKEAEQLYIKHCQKSDTIYYDRKMNIVNKQKFRYYIVQSIKKCSEDTTFEVHDKKSKRTAYKVSLGPVTDLKKDWVDIIGMYKLINNKEVYIFLKNVPKINNGLERIPDYIRKNLDIPIELKKDIKIKFIISPKGKITNLELTPKKLSSDIKEMITLVVYSMRDIKPASILGKKVNYEYYFKLDTTISIPIFNSND